MPRPSNVPRGKKKNPPTSEPTPTEPTATPVVPTPTPDGYKIYVIIVFNGACFKKYTDVSLVIDASTTMLEEDEHGRLKIESAKDAARAFVNQLLKFDARIIAPE